MAKTESTAVTRLIELAQQRPVEGDLDWFAARQPRRRAREEVTQVVRVARRTATVAPAAVAGAFVAGMLTVALTTWLTRREVAPPPAAAPPPAVASALPPPPPPPATVVTPIAVAQVAPVAGSDASPVAATAVVPVVEVVAEPLPVAVAGPAPPVAGPAPPVADRPARPRAPALAPRTRAARPTPVTTPLAELRVNSKPPCELYIDGRSMGWTPQRGISVSPGRHTVVFRNREHGVERKVIVDAQGGQVVRVIRDFTEP